MIEVDNFWHYKSFEVVIADLQRSQDEEIHKQENEALHCTENHKINGKLDEKKLLTSAVKVELQPVKSSMEKKAGNEKVVSQWRARQSQNWKVKIGLKRIIKWMKLRKSKQQ